MMKIPKSLWERTRRSPQEWRIAIDRRYDQIARFLLSPGAYRWMTSATRIYRPPQASGPDRYKPKPLESIPANSLIEQKIRDGAPLMVTRFGAYELAACSHYWRNILGQRNTQRNTGWPDDVLTPLCVNAGVFPRSAEMAIRCAERYRQDVKLSDILAVWYRPDEHVIWEHWCPQARPIVLDSLSPLREMRPWTLALEGKRVLVIHPFVKSIRSQYEKRLVLFKDRPLLPEMDLVTLQAVQGIGGHAGAEYKDWADALESMIQKMKELAFDVALIGAGAFGLPLAAEVKRMGKMSLHIGGALQLFFGVKGRRWEGRGVDKFALSEHWVRPLPEETPIQACKVEGGCYW